MKSMLIAVLASLSLCAVAQTVTDEPAKKPVTKDVAPKKTAPRKPAAPKKAVAPKKTQPPTSTSSTRVYTNDPKAPTLYDKQGNAIPTNPNAYDVSSAVGKK